MFKELYKKLFPDKPERYLVFYHGICYHKDVGIIHISGEFVALADLGDINKEVEYQVMRDWPLSDGYFNHEFPRKICLGKGAVKKYLVEMESW